MVKYQDSGVSRAKTVLRSDDRFKPGHRNIGLAILTACCSFLLACGSSSDDPTFTDLAYIQISDSRLDQSDSFDLEFMSSFISGSPNIPESVVSLTGVNSAIATLLEPDSCFSSVLTGDLVPGQSASTNPDDVQTTPWDIETIEIFRFGSLLTTEDSSGSATLLDSVDSIPERLNIGIRILRSNQQELVIDGIPEMTPLQIISAPEIPVVMGSTTFFWEPPTTSGSTILFTLGINLFSKNSEAVLCRAIDDGTFQLPRGLRDELLASGLSTEFNFVNVRRLITEFSTSGGVAIRMERISDINSLD